MASEGVTVSQETFEQYQRSTGFGAEAQAARTQASTSADAQVAADAQAREKLEGHLAILRATAADWQVRPAP